MMSLAVAIATRNRPADLRRALVSVGQQTSPPEEILVVDDSDPELREPVDAAVIEAAPHARLVRKTVPGLTRSRNLAADVLETDLVTFIDDDVVLDSGYLEAVRRCFLDREVGGVGGVVVNQAGFRHPVIARALGLGGRSEGKVLSSGWHTEISVTESDTQFLSGCNMTYRTSLVRGLRFDETAFSGYGLGEDLEFSHRLFRSGHRLRIAEDATLAHFSAAKTMDEGWGKQEVLVRPLVAGPEFSSLSFALAALARCAASASSGEWARAKGNFRGMATVLSGRHADQLAPVRKS